MIGGLKRKGLLLVVLLACSCALLAACKPSKDPRVRTLTDAAAVGDLATVEQMLESNVDPNGFWSYVPPITAAASNGHLDIVILLFEHGADPGLLDEDGDTVLVGVIIGHSNAETADWVLDHGADACAPLSMTTRERYSVGSIVELADALGDHEVAGLIAEAQIEQGCGPGG